MDPKTLFETIPTPPVAELLGWEFVNWDPEKNEISVRFLGKPQFLNPGGVVQGGILTAMVDDTMGPAVLLASGAKKLCQTIDLHAHFLRPVAPGLILSRANVVRMGQKIAFMEARLYDNENRLCLTATSSANLADVPR